MHLTGKNSGIPAFVTKLLSLPDPSTNSHLYNYNIITYLMTVATPSLLTNWYEIVNISGEKSLGSKGQTNKSLMNMYYYLSLSTKTDGKKDFINVRK